MIASLYLRSGAGPGAYASSRQADYRAGGALGQPRPMAHMVGADELGATGWKASLAVGRHSRRPATAPRWRGGGAPCGDVEGSIFYDRAWGWVGRAGTLSWDEN